MTFTTAMTTVALGILISVAAGATPLHDAAENGDANVIVRLLDSGTDANTLDKDGLTALHIAASYGHANLAKLLLDAGADPRVEEPTADLTALHFAAGTGDADTVRLLLESGIDANVRARYAVTPLHAAAIEGNASARLLLDADAEASARGRGWQYATSLGWGERQCRSGTGSARRPSRR